MRKLLMSAAALTAPFSPSASCTSRSASALEKRSG